MSEVPLYQREEERNSEAERGGQRGSEGARGTERERERERRNGSGPNTQVGSLLDRQEAQLISSAPSLLLFYYFQA